MSAFICVSARMPPRAAELLGLQMCATHPTFELVSGHVRPVL